MREIAILVVATDPVTLAADHIGRYAVHINANDVAVLGARPLWFFVVMLLPENRTTPELAETIMADVRSACEELDVAMGGGHTEITQGLDRPILVGRRDRSNSPSAENTHHRRRSNPFDASFGHRGHRDPRTRKIRSATEIGLILMFWLGPPVF